MLHHHHKPSFSVPFRLSFHLTSPITPPSTNDLLSQAMQSNGAPSTARKRNVLAQALRNPETPRPQAAAHASGATLVQDGVAAALVVAAEVGVAVVSPAVVALIASPTGGRPSLPSLMLTLTRLVQMRRTLRLMVPRVQLPPPRLGVLPLSRMTRPGVGRRSSAGMHRCHLSSLRLRARKSRSRRTAVHTLLLSL